MKRISSINTYYLLTRSTFSVLRPTDEKYYLLAKKYYLLNRSTTYWPEVSTTYWQEVQFIDQRYYLLTMRYFTLTCICSWTTLKGQHGSKRPSVRYATKKGFDIGVQPLSHPVRVFFLPSPLFLVVESLY